ncbi:DEHA2A07282p [Debaryomyces hansenii CBS767]|uniref:DEHA2A07282p n=1 Tax=Debaryomyces hansenii (strain ATCC 36239 / CBS 767 / BCRC 21394 / JCM 1990 / NBRC 0083 / IGC 2968) TaxID=284592 RepID=Q6BYS6_DEBHA|nr:DEHA2A07282p [Debaryomyces hansenii CBS767]CAG84599.2 DEHA2A07282p [Debaryomyces hansenii CBS767]|eukprot:XP_456643.2 DEHA2A07282p [Debaryomyces hansenii CBS767]
MMTLPNDEPTISPDDAATAAAVAAASTAAAAVAAIPQLKDDDHSLHHQFVQQHHHQLQEQHAHQQHALQQHHQHHQHHQHPHEHDHDQLNSQLNHQLQQHNLAHHQLNHTPHHHLEMLAQANEEDFLDSTNRKVAPRSSDLFKVGPQFSETRHHQDIYCKRNDMDVNPILEARIDRGFEVGENGTWIGYKRNYFTLVASFSLENFNFDRFIQNKFYTYEKSSKNGESVGENKVEISYFAIRLVAKCSDDDVAISLVQHTAKRDKGPQFPPPIYPAVPGDLPDHETVRASCNKRNGNKIENMNKVFYFDRAEYYHNTNLDTLKDDSVLKNYPSDSIARVARFERIQFTSSIRLKSTSVNSRYFTLHVELLGIIENEDCQIQPILLSSIETPPLIIRGRSPSNYHKDRTSGYRGHI